MLFCGGLHEANRDFNVLEGIYVKKQTCSNVDGARICEVVLKNEHPVWEQRDGQGEYVFERDGQSPHLREELLLDLSASGRCCERAIPEFAM